MSPRGRRANFVDQADDDMAVAAGRALLREVDSTITLDPALEAAADDPHEPPSTQDPSA